MPKHYEPFQLPYDIKCTDYFIAVAKGENIHSFVMLGVIVDDKPVFLARVGKVGLPHEAKLQRESIYPYGKLSYQAYAITYQHYLDFIRLMEKSNNAEALTCYYRDDINHFECKTIYVYKKEDLSRPPLSDDEQQVIDGTKKLTLFNTCRHTATDIVAHVVGDKSTTDRISRLYFINLPVTAHFVDGQTEDYFYVFPLPPSGFCEVDDNLKYKQLTVIYKRMEALITKEPQHQITKKKFDALKKLYIEQAGIPDTHLDVALQSILQWQEDNRTLVSYLRKPSFFSRCFGLKSSTETMVTSLTQELEEELEERLALT
jgi:hypothetical protein